MARSEHPPIYKAAYDLCLYFEHVVHGFSRDRRYAIGAHLREWSLRVLRLVVRANARFDKAPVLYRLREELEKLKVLIRLSHDAKAFPNFDSFEIRQGLAPLAVESRPFGAVVRQSRRPHPEPRRGDSREPGA